LDKDLKADHDRALAPAETPVHGLSISQVCIASTAHQKPSTHTALANASTALHGKSWRPFSSIRITSTPTPGRRRSAIEVDSDHREPVGRASW
jgi:hypothetical protein